MAKRKKRLDGYNIVINIGGEHFPPIPHHVRFDWAIGRPELKGGKPMELNCTNEEKILVTVNPVTPAGHSISLDGPVVVVVVNGLGTVEMVDDVSFWLVSSDEPGDTSFSVSGDADLGDGVVNVADVIVLHVSHAMAQTLGLSAAAPVLK